MSSDADRSDHVTTDHQRSRHPAKTDLIRQTQIGERGGRLVDADIRGSQAFARALERVGILTADERSKMENPEDLENMSNFYETGFDDILPISAKFRKNLDLLTDKITAFLPEKRHHEQITDIKIALVGRPNAGKSSLLNRMTGAGVLVEDALFATLDPTVRRAATPSGRVFTLADTTGNSSGDPKLRR